MIKIGKTNRLTVVNSQGGRIFLADGQSARVLLKDHRPSVRCQVGDVLEVMVYVDSEGHLAATSAEPKAQIGEVAWLTVVAVNYYGAFLDWGVPKDLLVPFSEQLDEMKVGRNYLVKLFLDAKSRIAATARIEGLISDTASDFAAGQKVSLLIAEKTELGFKAVVNHEYWGLLYQNELFQELAVGQKLEGFVKRLRDDGKLDLTLQQPGYGKVDMLTQKILAQLRQNQGQLSLSDKSPPEAIYAAFGVSKKVYKQAIGALYKQHLIAIEEDGIRLL